MTTQPPVALTIAGSDSGGGAGIQADLRTFAALGVFGTSAITAVTAQDTTGVHAVHVVPTDMVVEQVRAVAGDLHPAAVKTGMLATATTVGAVGAMAAVGVLPNLVVDPVMVSSSGARLLDAEAERAYLSGLFPHARVVTPNLHEAGVLVGRVLHTRADVTDAAHHLHGTGAEVVVIKGGHPTADDPGSATDVWFDGDRMHELPARRIDTVNNHGSGCSFAAAVAAHLAAGAPVADALAGAKEFVTGALTASADWHLGAGHGPLDHTWRQRA